MSAGLSPPESVSSGGRAATHSTNAARRAIIGACPAA